MNIQKFTQKSIEAVQGLEKAAYEFGNQEIEQEHLLYNLLKQENSLIAQMIEKMGIAKTYFEEQVEQAIGARPKVQGGEPFMGQELNKILLNAPDELSQIRYLQISEICSIHCDLSRLWIEESRE